MTANQLQNREEEREKSAERLPAASGGEESLAGFFQASCSSYNLRLLDVPGYYKIIVVASAVLGERALLEFDWHPLNINIPMVKEVRAERNAVVMLSIGGENGNFHFLNGYDKVTNFYNSLVDLYQDWDFDGVNFDLRTFDNHNRDFLIKAIRWFNDTFPEAILSITAKAVGVSPAAGGIYGGWNELVPVINELKDCLDRVQIMAYGFGPAFEELVNSRCTPTPTSSPGFLQASPPASGIDRPIPLTDPQGMLEYIFRSYAEPFTFWNPAGNGESNEVTGYDGFAVDKLMLAVPPDPGVDPQYFVNPGGIKQVMKTLQDRYNETPAEIMISTINSDARDGYSYSTQFTAGQEGLNS